jgi:hypothetical protein
MRRAILASTFLGLALVVQGYTASASTLRPYTPDPETLHLWHMNDQSVPVIDTGSDGTHLTALRNGATLGNVSYRGFGTALSTYDGGPEATNDAGHDAYLAARPLVNGSGDNVVINYCGASGAFTFEALVRIDFDPEASVSTNSMATNHGNFMQLINLDADESTNRVCQFRVVPAGLFKTNAEPLLEFINLNRDKSPQSLSAVIPMNGVDAIKFGGWYHVAVTFNGNTNEADNLRFYWTLADPSRAKASQIGSGQMVHELPSGCEPDFAIGQTGRQSPVTPYPNQNFLGLIDEVRMSGVARSDTQMLFDGQPVVVAGAPGAAMTVASTTTPGAEVTSPQASASEKAKAPIHEEGKSESWTDKLTTANALIAAAFVIIAGLLCWLLYVLRKLVFGSGKVPVVVAVPSQKVAVNNALQDATAMLKEVDSLISQANEYQPAQSRSSSSTTRFKKKGEIEEMASEKKEGEPEIGFRGVMRRVGLEDLIQLECMNCKSTILEIANVKLNGRIYIESGAIIHAVAGSLTGEPALYKLLALRGGEFSFKTLEEPERRTIHGQWMQLLMEAAQARDEETTFITAEEPKGFSFTPSTSTPEEIVAMATLLGDHPHVKELVLIANEGNVLYSSKCPDSQARATACNELLEAAKAVSGQLPLGEFHHLEIINNQTRTVIQPAQGHHLMIGTPAESAGTPG